MGRRFRRVGAAGLAAAVVLGAVSAYLLRDPSQVGYWRSSDARATYLERYDRALALLGLKAWMLSPEAGHA